MSYNSFIKQAACETPKVVVDPIDKEDKIYDMLNGHVKDMSMWMPKRKPRKNLDKTAEDKTGPAEQEVRSNAADKAGYTSGEALLTLLGGLGGGGLGYLLSHLAGVKNKRKRLLWALLGGGAGALGTHFGMDISGSDGKSIRRRMREATADSDALAQAKEKDEAAERNKDNYTLGGLISGSLGFGERGRTGRRIGSGLGAIWGMTPWRFDISGRKAAAGDVLAAYTGNPSSYRPTDTKGMLSWLFNLRNKNINELTTNMQGSVNPKGKPIVTHNSLTARNVGSFGADVLAHALIGRAVGGAVDYGVSPYVRGLGGVLKDLDKARK